jgi:hypothetical protein
MRRIEFAYAMYFNRSHDRDGHLVQGRFRSRPVGSSTYLHVLVAYIDWNAVDARIVDDPSAYPHCSAWHFAHPKGPPWLERTWTEETVCRMASVRHFSPAAYVATIGARPTRGRLRLVVPRLLAPPGRDDLDDLLAAAPARLREWFERRARAADGMGLGPPLVDRQSVDEAVRSLSAGGWTVSPRGRSRNARPVLHAALLRTLSRLSSAEIGRRLGLSHTRVADVLAAHRELVHEDARYATELTRVAQDAIRRCHGEDTPGQESASRGLTPLRV